MENEPKEEPAVAPAEGGELSAGKCKSGCKNECDDACPFLEKATSTGPETQEEIMIMQSAPAALEARTQSKDEYLVPKACDNCGCKYRCRLPCKGGIPGKPLLADEVDRYEKDRRNAEINLGKKVMSPCAQCKCQYQCFARCRSTDTNPYDASKDMIPSKPLQKSQPEPPQQPPPQQPPPQEPPPQQPPPQQPQPIQGKICTPVCECDPYKCNPACQENEEKKVCYQCDCTDGCTPACLQANRR